MFVLLGRGSAPSSNRDSGSPASDDSVNSSSVVSYNASQPLV